MGERNRNPSPDPSPKRGGEEESNPVAEVGGRGNPSPKRGGEQEIHGLTAGRDEQKVLPLPASGTAS